MKRFNKAAPILLLSCVALFSCVDEPVQIEEENLVYQIPQTNKVLTRSTSLETYETLPNPYALDVMQQVYDIYSESPVTLQPTDLYVKFMPKDSLELHTLKYDCDLELFDYPLDIELAEGEEYINYDLPETDLVWLYTTVSPDYVFPQGISYEILEECYIPEDGETVGIPAKAGEVNVEDAAFAMVGYSEMASVVTRAVATPSGTIQVYDNDNNAHVPVKGVKIRCHRFVKLATAYTNESGYYTMNKVFRYTPRYEVVFDNIKDFDIWGNWGPSVAASHYMGFQSSLEIQVADKSWTYAAVNNAAYDYYTMCEQKGISKPVSDLKIWVWKNIVPSSAPMLNPIKNVLNINRNIIENFLIDIPKSLIHLMLKYVTPDITIGALDNGNTLKTYAQLYQVVNHELAHASHFSVVGPSFWLRYINYIIQNWGYGDGTHSYAELCAVGEMWGYYIGYAQAMNKGYSPTYNINGVYGWIHPLFFWWLDSRGIISSKKIFNCLSSEVDTYNELISKMYILYPDKAVQIAGLLKHFPSLNRNVSLPNYDTVYIGENITSSTNISGDRLAVHDVTVASGVTFTVNAETSITFVEPFVVDSGAQLLVTIGN